MGKQKKIWKLRKIANSYRYFRQNELSYFQNWISYFEISSEPLKRHIYDEEYRKLARACRTGGAYISLADSYSQRERDAEEFRSLLGKLDYEFERQSDIVYKNTKVLKKHSPSS